MVSRSLEKMMLIAIGLSTAVIIGIPVLVYSIDLMTTTQRVQTANLAAQQILNATRMIDTGELDNTTIEVYLPEGFEIVVDNTGYSLSISLSLEEEPPESNIVWSETFSHLIVINAPPTSGNFIMFFNMESDVIQISYV